MSGQARVSHEGRSRLWITLVALAVMVAVIVFFWRRRDR